METAKKGASMKIRINTGQDVYESMQTVQEIPATKQAVAEFATKWYSRIIEHPINPDDIVVIPEGRDDRIKWDSHLVAIVGHGVFGWTDGPVV